MKKFYVVEFLNLYRKFVDVCTHTAACRIFISWIIFEINFRLAANQRRAYTYFPLI